MRAGAFWRAQEMVSLVVGEFKTGAGLHSGEVVIGNVGSSDKMEFTVLRNTVNLASRLESLNKENKTKMLLLRNSNRRGRVSTPSIRCCSGSREN